MFIPAAITRHVTITAAYRHQKSYLCAVIYGLGISPGISGCIPKLFIRCKSRNHVD
jgi:hypothetical protein